MLKPNTIVETISNSGKGITKNGNHFIQKLSKDIFTSTDNDKLFVEAIPDQDPEVDDILEEFFDKTTKRASEFNWVFTGKVNNSSVVVMRKWLIKAILYSTNNKSRLLINEKLKNVKTIIDLFLSVFNIDGSESEKCILKYTLVTSNDRSLTDLLITPEWYDLTLSRGGNGMCSAYKIFYILAAQSENATDSNKLVEHQYLHGFSNEYFSSSLKKITNALKKVNFSDSEIEEIFDTIHSIIQCSHFTTKGNKKTLEFLGVEHLKSAAKCLKVKYEKLYDFLIQEYTWKDNKKRLNTPENINRRVGSFITRLYEVILSIIFDRINICSDPVSRLPTQIKINFFYCLPLPKVNNKQMLTHGDFIQYCMCSDFDMNVASIIDEKVKTFGKYTGRNMTVSGPPDGSSYLIVRKIAQWISNLIEDSKDERNKFEQLKKMEKNYENKIKFLKEPTVEIFIPELKLFAKFNWESFIENSETYDSKQMDHLLKMSSISIFQTYKSDVLLSLVPKNDFTLDIPMAINTFIVHSLIEDDQQDEPKYSFTDQIRDNNLDNLSIDEIGFIPIPLDIFVERYRMLFLNHNDECRRPIDSSSHAIRLLKLDRSWCCENYAHLQRSHIEKLDILKENFIKNVITVQGYFKIITSKLKLKRLRAQAKVYKDTYNTSIEQLQELSTLFEREYTAICLVDLDNMDIDLFKQLNPSMTDVDDLKMNTFQWLKVVVMEGSNMLATKTFNNRNVCISYSDDTVMEGPNIFDLHEALLQGVNRSQLSPFIIKINLNSLEDVILEFRSKRCMYAWSQKSAVNQQLYSHMSQSSGVLYQEKEYRLFSMDYMLRKIAYSVMNRIPYSFNAMLNECSFAIIVAEDSLYPKMLSKSPLWLFFTNIYPIANLSSHSFFNKVDKEIRKIDRNECFKLVKGPSTRPRDNWLTEDVYTELMLLSLDKESDDSEFNLSYYMNLSRVSYVRPSIGSIAGKPWSKINYKQRKYKFKGAH